MKIFQNKQPAWLSVPLKKIRGVEFVPINEMQIAGDKNFTHKHLKTIENNYKKAPFFTEVMPFIESWYQFQSEFIIERNIHFLQNLLSSWNIAVKIYFSSKLDCHSTDNKLLIEIIEKVGGTEYLFGAGSVAYLKAKLFEEAGIKLIAQNYTHPIYDQFNAEQFTAGLSCIDALMNCGINGVKDLVCDRKLGL